MKKPERNNKSSMTASTNPYNFLMKRLLEKKSTIEVSNVKIKVISSQKETKNVSELACSQKWRKPMLISFPFACTSQWFTMKIFSMPEQTRTRQVIQIQNKYPTFISHHFLGFQTFILWIHLLIITFFILQKKGWFFDAHFCFLPIRCKIQSYLV